MQRLYPFFRLCTLGFVVHCCGSGTATVTAETWTDLRGTTTVEAEMIGLWDGQVFLRRENGDRVSVPLQNLRADSRIQAQNLAAKMEAARAKRIKEFRRQAEAALAPAPDPIAQPPAAPKYQPPENSDDPASYFRSIDTQIRNGHVLVLYDALPRSFRKDLDGLAKLAAVKVDERSWQSLIESLHNLGDVVVGHQNWFFSHPSMQGDNAAESEVADDADESESDEQFNSVMLSLAGLLRAGFDPDALDISKLKDQPLRDWLAERDSAVAPFLAELFAISSLSPFTFFKEEKNGKATGVRITTDKEDIAVGTKRVEGTWLPSSVADQWESRIAAARRQLQESADQSLLAEAAPIVASTTLNSLTGPLANAESRGEFHAAMQPLLAFMKSALQAMQSGAGLDLGLVSYD